MYTFYDKNGNFIFKTTDISPAPSADGLVRQWQKAVNLCSISAGTDFTNWNFSSTTTWEMANGSFISNRPNGNYSYLDFKLSDGTIIYSYPTGPLGQGRDPSPRYFYMDAPNGKTANFLYIFEQKYDIVVNIGVVGYGPTAENWKTWWNGLKNEDETETSGGGDGDLDKSTDTIPIPALPGISVIDTGMLRIYDISAAQLQALATWLWSSNPFENIPKLFSSPMESIISLKMIDCSPSVSDLSTTVIIGNISSNSTAKILANQYLNFDCGTININEYFGSFLDYNLTEILIYLPFIGFQKLNIDEVMDSACTLNYKIDMLTGSCVAVLKVVKNKPVPCFNAVTYSWNGKVATDMPLTASDYTQILRNVASLVATGVTLCATAGAGGIALGGAAVAAGGTALNALTNSKVSVAHSGVAGDLSGFFNVQTPYIFIKRPVLQNPTIYSNLVGYPCNITDTLNNFSGFTTAEVSDIDTIQNATESEKSEIESLLRNGIYV